MIKKLQLMPLNKSILSTTKKNFSYNSIYSEPVDICYYAPRENICLMNVQFSEKENVNESGNEKED